MISFGRDAVFPKRTADTALHKRSFLFIYAGMVFRVGNGNFFPEQNGKYPAMKSASATGKRADSPQLHPPLLLFLFHLPPLPIFALQILAL